MQRPTNARLVRTSVIAAAWFLALTLLSLATTGGIRATVLYAVPVAFAAWRDVRLGFVFAAVGSLSAWVGGAIPHPGMDESVWIEGLWAFVKLCAVAIGSRLAAQSVQRRRAR